MTKGPKRAARTQAWREHYTPDEMRQRFLISLSETHMVTETCRILGVKSTTVAAWRRTFPKFGEEVSSFISTRHESDSAPVFIGGAGEPKDRYGKPANYLRRYRKTRSMRDAAIFCGVTAFEVQEWRNSESAKYDKEYDQLMKSEEIMDLWDVEETMLREARGRPAQVVDGEQLAKEIPPNAKVGQFLLERRLTHKYGPPTAHKKVTHEVELTWFTDGGTRMAASTMKELMDKTAPVLVDILEDEGDASDTSKPS